MAYDEQITQDQIRIHELKNKVERLEMEIEALIQTIIALSSR